LEKKHSLWALQNMLVEAENEANEADLSEIIGQIADKVDALKEVIDILESEAARFKKYKDEMAARQKSLTNAVARLKAYALKCLDEHGTEFEAGNIWVLKKRTSKAVEILKEPDLDSYLRFSAKDPGQGLIKQSFVWDKKEIASKLKEGADLSDIAEIKTNSSIQFSTINKGAKK